MNFDPDMRVRGQYIHIYIYEYACIYIMSLTLLVGCMFSGKSTELIRRVKCLKSIGHTVLVINHSKDKRYSTVEEVVTHSGNAMGAIKCDTLDTIDVREFEVVAIDEAQFFPDLFENVLKFLNLKKKVLVAGLISDYKREPIGQVPELISKADEIVQLRAYCSVCKNGTLASFTKRISKETEQVVVGVNKYVAVCRQCYPL